MSNVVFAVTVTRFVPLELSDRELAALRLYNDVQVFSEESDMDSRTYLIEDLHEQFDDGLNVRGFPRVRLATREEINELLETDDNIVQVLLANSLDNATE